MKNNGFSLIELLVAIAVSSIILLMLSFMLVESTGMFNSENDEIDMRNDYQIAKNELAQTIMEAKSLTIVKAGADMVIYTGEVDPLTNHLVVEGTPNQTTERIITYVKSQNTIYISKRYDKATDEANVFSDKVESFRLSINSACLKDNGQTGDDREEYYTNPLDIDVKLAISGVAKENDMDSNFKIRTRNILRKVNVYTATDRDTLLKNVDTGDVVEMKVK